MIFAIHFSPKNGTPEAPTTDDNDNTKCRQDERMDAMDILVPNRELQTARTLNEAANLAAKPTAYEVVEASNTVR